MTSEITNIIYQNNTKPSKTHTGVEREREREREREVVPA